MSRTAKQKRKLAKKACTISASEHARRKRNGEIRRRIESGGSLACYDAQMELTLSLITGAAIRRRRV